MEYPNILLHVEDNSGNDPAAEQNHQSYDTLRDDSEIPTNEDAADRNYLDDEVESEDSWEPPKKKSKKEVGAYNMMDVSTLASMADRIQISSKKVAQIANATTAVLMKHGFINVTGHQISQVIPTKLLFVGKKIDDSRVSVRKSLNIDYFSKLEGKLSYSISSSF